jgi:hypothetical protein
LNDFRTNVEPYFGCEDGGGGNPLRRCVPIDGSLKQRIMMLSV